MNSKIYSTPIAYQNSSSLKPVSSNDIFCDRSTYISSMRLFYAYFQEVPNCKYLTRIDGKKAKSWFEETYSSMIDRVHSKEKYDIARKCMEAVDSNYVLHNGILVDFERDIVGIIYAHSMEQEAQAILQQFLPFIKRKKKTREISLVVNGLGGLTTHAMNLQKPNLHITKQYNDDLSPVHTKILGSLKKQRQSGLILLHGVPGTGKSTYIRFLIHQHSKPVIFLPPSLALQMDSPAFMDFLTENKNSVFVIEDAEELLVAREGQRHSSISMLLNITDGLLGECLGIQVIATFNTHLSLIDKALMRKGRLIALYEFKPLCAEKTRALLLEEMGIAIQTPSKEMTLAEIYHMEEETFELKKERTPIGFRVQIA